MKKGKRTVMNGGFIRFLGITYYSGRLEFRVKQRVHVEKNGRMLYVYSFIWKNPPDLKRRKTQIAHKICKCIPSPDTKVLQSSLIES